MFGVGARPPSLSTQVVCVVGGVAEGWCCGETDGPSATVALASGDQIRSDLHSFTLNWTGRNNYQPSLLNFHLTL